jgi:thiol:disulfide interchange protein
MKTLTILFAGILITTLVYAKPWKSGSETKNETGIVFHQGTWDEALKQAKKEGKPIFLDISASWCGPCKMLKSRTFPNEEVGEFYNTNFINVAVDGEKGEGVELARKYKIQGYPSLIYIDSNGQLIAQTAGYRNPKQLIDIGKQIIQK